MRNAEYAADGGSATSSNGDRPADINYFLHETSNTGIKYGEFSTDLE